MKPRPELHSAAQSQPLPQSPRPPLLLALAVHWDDCSVALGTREGLTTEVWSQQPEARQSRAQSREPAGLAADLPAGLPAGNVSGSNTGPLASRDALLLVDRLLVRTGTSLGAIDQLCFARGPGAFTSLRVAAGLIQGLSLATSIPVAGVCSLAAMVAQEPGWQEPDRVGAPTWLQLSAIDARMGECYFGLHQCRSGHYPVALIPPAVGSPAEAVAVFDEVLAQRAAHDAAIGIVLAGNAFRLLPQLAAWSEAAGFDPAAAAVRSPTAAAVLAVAASIGAPPPGPPQTALPVYVRDKIALDVNEQRSSAAARALAALGKAAS
jgi:tRNA threonylcarbamoyladenosine biosynthesis protein TsaB